MASLRKSKKLATRRALSEAAARILLREGFEGLTISLVAKESGVSVRTFHNYFPSIDEALFQFCLDSIDKFLPVVERSEERRVGKECKSGGMQRHLTEK